MVLQKYDLEREEARAKFDLERDKAQRQFIAALMGVKLDDGPTTSTDNRQKRTMTQQDIMRDHAK